ncbi:hypothetical protein [Acinetobacter modestus]|uniref:hypothetical protein n=1 Tax=Acinetobacter modestus TaxID=1776740 RepID=UPI0030197F3F
MSVLRELVDIQKELGTALNELLKFPDEIVDEIVGSVSFLDDADCTFKRMIKDKRTELKNAITILDRVLDLSENTYYSEWDNMIKQIELDKDKLMEML